MLKSKFKFFLLFTFVLSLYLFTSYAKEETESKESKIEPIIVNGDTVEYSTDKREFTAFGNVSVEYKGALLTGEKMTVNSETKDAQVQGQVRLDEQQGVIEGEEATYNFQSKTGTIISSQFRSYPYFGRAKQTKKVSENEFISYRGYMGTCNYDNPHYRIKSRKMSLFPGDKVQVKDSIFYAGKIPLAYLPQYNRSLKDPLMHVQVMPGKSKEWGSYSLSAWRYNLAENITGRIYLDYREKMGVAQGLGSNYSGNFGKGDFKYYYLQERPRNFDEGIPAEFQRYFIRWRHQWAIGPATNLISEYYKIVDSKRVLHGSQYNILKDYFYREYEKDTQPLSYAQLHHSFSYSNLDVLVQKRINRWYSQEEKLPQVNFSLPSFQVGDSPFYFQNDSAYTNYNSKSAVPSESWNDRTYNTVSTSNKFSLPMKLAFIKLTPSISGAHTYYDKNSTYGSTATVTFATGSDMSTKFYRVFNLQSNFLGLDINGLRHIITPSIGYSYSHSPTMPASKFRLGGGASYGVSSAALELSNKLQTKRDNQKVDIADLRVNSTYAFKPKGGRGSTYSDLLFDLELIPYSWLRIDADATYKHSGSHSDINFGRFSTINYDINFNFAPERTIGIGQRYERKGGKELTFDLDWRLTPKWKFGVYERYQFINNPPTYRVGLREQEYFLSRDLHCWTAEFTYNVKEGEGEAIWLVFRLKAFPELEFNYNQQYHQPKPGSQGYHYN